MKRSYTSETSANLYSVHNIDDAHEVEHYYTDYNNTYCTNFITTV